MAQLVERSLPIAEIHSSNAVIGKFDLLTTVLNLYSQKERKRGRNGPFYNNQVCWHFRLIAPFNNSIFFYKKAFSIAVDRTWGRYDSWR